MQENSQQSFESASAQTVETIEALIPTPFDKETAEPDHAEAQADPSALDESGSDDDPPVFSLFDDEDFQPQEPINPVWKFLSNLLNFYPLVFWAGMWAIVLVAGAIAVTLLTNPKISRREPLPNLPSTKLEESDGHFPLWPLGMIALACAGGTLVLARRLDHQKRLAELPEPLTLEEINAVFPNLASAAPIDVEVRVQSSLDPASAEGSAMQFRVASPESLQPSSDSSPTQPPPVEVLSGSTAPEFAANPNWEKTPLDYRAPGLAEVLEIQRRRSHKRKPSR